MDFHELLSLTRKKYRLTPRESEVLAGMLKGASSRDIAKSLYIAPSTAHKHCFTVIRKLNLCYKRELPCWLLTEFILKKGREEIDGKALS